ncbi:MAG: virulence factor [Alphaproteobacteria bacterium]|nr:virulence factor [Alphaproteobacteria bacterium]
MLASPPIGHNSRASRAMYAIAFDLDTDTLRKTYHAEHANNAYADIRRELAKYGFRNMQGSVYFGDETVDAVTCVRAVQKITRKYSWFGVSVRDIRMLRIEDNNDLMPAIQDMISET